MMGEQEHYELIERYLSGEMEGEELTLFEAQLDDKLRAEIDLHKSIQDASQETDVINFRSFVKESIAEEKEEVPVQKNNRPSLWKIAIAAAFATFLVAMINLLLSDQQVSNERLYISYFTPYQDLVTVRDQQSDVIAEAMRYYNDKNYLKAISEFENLDLSNNPASSLYFGISLMAVNQLDQAKIPLNKVLLSDNIYIPHAQWYLALIELRQGKTTEAIKAFSQIASNEPNSIYFKEAKEILDKIDDLNE